MARESSPNDATLTADASPRPRVGGKAKLDPVEAAARTYVNRTRLDRDREADRSIPSWRKRLELRLSGET